MKKLLMVLSLVMLASCSLQLVGKEPSASFDSHKSVEELVSCIGDNWEQKRYGLLKSSLTIHQRNTHQGVSITGMNDFAEFIRAVITKSPDERLTKIEFVAASDAIAKIYEPELVKCL